MPWANRCAPSNISSSACIETGYLPPIIWHAKHKLLLKHLVLDVGYLNVGAKSSYRNNEYNKRSAEAIFVCSLHVILLGSLHRDTLHVTYEVFTAVTMKNVVFWDVTPCGSSKSRRFGGTCRLHHQG
jgi:hypothetical protein